jgi:hypothetical protein
MTLKQLFDTSNPDNNLGPFLVAAAIALAVALLVIIPHVAHR